MTQPPDGFAPHVRSSPVTDSWAPLFSRASPEAVAIGFFVARAHCNARDLLHGGVIAALSDQAMGLSLGAVLRTQAQEVGGGGLLTTSLSVDYLAPGRVGAWVLIAPRVLKAGVRSALVDALVTADGGLIARAHAAFHVPRKETA